MGTNCNCGGGRNEKQVECCSCAVWATNVDNDLKEPFTEIKIASASNPSSDLGVIFDLPKLTKGTTGIAWQKALFEAMGCSEMDSYQHALQALGKHLKLPEQEIVEHLEASLLDAFHDLSPDYAKKLEKDKFSKIKMTLVGAGVGAGARAGLGYALAYFGLLPAWATPAGWLLAGGIALGFFLSSGSGIKWSRVVEAIQRIHDVRVPRTALPEPSTLSNWHLVTGLVPSEPGSILVQEHIVDAACNSGVHPIAIKIPRLELFETLLSHVPGIAGSAIGAAKAIDIVWSPEVAAGLANGSLKQVAGRFGGLRLLAQGTNGAFSGHGEVVSSAVAQPLLLGAFWQLAARVTCQAYLVRFNVQLQSIQSGIDDVHQFQHDEKVAEMLAAWDYFWQYYEHLQKGEMQEDDWMHLRNGIENVEKVSLECENLISLRYRQLKDALRGSSTDDAVTKVLDEHGQLLRLSQITISRRLFAAVAGLCLGQSGPSEQRLHCAQQQYENLCKSYREFLEQMAVPKCKALSQVPAVNLATRATLNAMEALFSEARRTKGRLQEAQGRSAGVRIVLTPGGQVAEGYTLLGKA